MFNANEYQPSPLGVTGVQIGKLDEGANQLIDYLSAGLGPAVLALALIIFAYGYMMNARNQMDRGIQIAIGGGILFAVRPIVAFFKSVFFG